MEKSIKCIVKDYDQNKYQVVDFDAANSPNNLVLDTPEYNNIHGRKYQIVKHDIDVFWTIGFKVHAVYFRKDKVELLKVQSPSIQTVCEYLNKFESMTSEEFEAFEEKVKNKS